MRNATLRCVIGALLLLGATVPAQAQYVNPYTHNNWNNPNSSLIDTMLMGMRNQAMLNNMINSSHASDSALRAAITKQIQTGQSRIKSGQATTRFTIRTFPTDYWVMRSGGNTPEKRKQYTAEFAIQRDIWAQEARTRGTDLSDMAQSLGLTFVLAWEAQTGQKPTTAQYKGITQDFRDMLLKNPLYQGMDATAKQTYSEGLMANSTDAVRLLREAQRTGDAATLQKARTSGANYVNSWLPRGYTRYEATLVGFKENK